MSVKNIRATFGCDGCGTEFWMEMDPADGIPEGWTLFDGAVDYLRGGQFGGYVGEKRSGRYSGPQMTSVQGGMHLCPTCTKTVDEKVPEEGDPTEEQVKEALKLIDDV